MLASALGEIHRRARVRVDATRAEQYSKYFDKNRSGPSRNYPRGAGATKVIWGKGLPGKGKSFVVMTGPRTLEYVATD